MVAYDHAFLSRPDSDGHICCFYLTCYKQRCVNNLRFPIFDRAFWNGNLTFSVGFPAFLVLISGVLYIFSILTLVSQKNWKWLYQSVFYPITLGKVFFIENKYRLWCSQMYMHIYFFIFVAYTFRMLVKKTILSFASFLIFGFICYLSKVYFSTWSEVGIQHCLFLYMDELS